MRLLLLVFLVGFDAITGAAGKVIALTVTVLGTETVFGNLTANLSS